MPVIARDAVASDHLVYAWPFPIGPDEYDVSCADDELVVMCPAWLVGGSLGPGRHRWRSPDPMRPSAAYFVLTAPVEVSFDMVTQFIVPVTGQSVRLRAQGSLQVRCVDPALLIAQFVGLPFDSVNDGVLRSVSRSIERMLARLLTRRVVMAATPHAVTDPQMLSNIIEELVAYNPTAGAVFGVELVRFGHMQIHADDGSTPLSRVDIPIPDDRDGRTVPLPIVAMPTTNPSRTKADTLQPPPGQQAQAPEPPPVPPVPVRDTPPPTSVSGEIVAKPKVEKITAPGHHAPPSQTVQTPVVPPPPSAAASPSAPAIPPIPKIPIPSMPKSGSSTVSSSSGATASGTLDPNRPMPSPLPRRAGSISVPDSDDGDAPKDVVSGEIGGNKSKATTPLKAESRDDAGLAQGTPAPTPKRGSDTETGSRGSILGIGVSHIGSSEVVGGEITKKIAPGGRVLVPGPNGLMQSATVRQLLQGYYELEVGGSGETIWVPVNGVVPE